MKYIGCTDSYDAYILCGLFIVMSEGPTILWGELKGKKVKSNDGKNLGDIGKLSQNYIRLESGTINKKKFWVPKYYADTFDGKTLWLVSSKDEISSKFYYGKEPSAEQFSKDLDEYNQSKPGTRGWDPERVRFDQGKAIGEPTKPKETASGYDNVRDLK